LPEGKLYSFIESKIFTKQLDQKASLDVLLAIEDDLLKDPERGDVVRGTHGARKARIGDPLEHRGKSGAYRYLYLYLEHKGRIYLLYFYGKNELHTLGAEQIKMIARMVDRLKTELDRSDE
jgi:mRNA-degrading endonuclease RelE of RelBE toxin-antitoxin system